MGVQAAYCSFVEGMLFEADLARQRATRHVHFVAITTCDWQVSVVS